MNAELQTRRSPNYFYRLMLRERDRVLSALRFNILTIVALITAHASQIPTADQIFSLAKLPEPLVPIGAEHPPEENRLLIAALDRFEARREADDFSGLEDFVATKPHSVWNVALNLNLGLLYYNAGYFSKCIPIYLKAWKQGKDSTEPRVKAMVDRAAGEYTKMLARVGRYSELKAFLKEVEGRTFVGQATELMMAGTEGSTIMERRPEIAFRCGPLALSRILASQRSPLWSAPEIVNAKSTMKGMSLAEVSAISETLGMNYQAAKRPMGAQIIIPSVIHWKVGHYAALVKKEADRYLTQDPTFENETWHTLKALEEEASGYFLVPPGALPQGWAAVNETEARQVFGKGQTSGGNPNATGGGDNQSGGDADDPSPNCSKGMATYSFHTMLASLRLQDTPVGYNPPYGYPVNFTVTYTQREATQPSNFAYSNLGSKWNCNWLDYISDDPANPAVASRGTPGGGGHTFSGYNSTTKQFAVQFDSSTVLTRTTTTPISYTLAHPDGSVSVYAKSDGSSVAGRKVFLTQRIDPFGNATTLTYDAQLRITTITDALGQQTTIAYGVASDIYKITQITDPFGRFAIFSYDASGRLVTIQDVIGIQSVFTYDGTGDFIKTLTTPYGTTNFTTAETAGVRTLTATDPAGDTEVLESFVAASSPAITATEPSVPQGMTVLNNYLNYRNSFYWDKKQWHDYPKDYSKAHLYHWLHEANFSTMGRYLESERPALQSRIWYAYPGQAVGVVGTASTPIATGRVIEGGTQLTKQTLNALNLPASQIDPLSRTTNYEYAANNVDILAVSQVIQGSPATSVTLGSYTCNTQHLPLTYTDAAGQTTNYTWNANGQMTTLTNAKSETTTFTYYTADVAGKQRKGRLYQIDRALAGNSDVTIFDYDAKGRMASVTGPDGYFLNFTYDNLDRPLRVTYPDATFTETTYQALDPQTWRDRLGRTTAYVYNSLRQVHSIIDPAGRMVQYRWCKCGALNQLIDAMGRVTIWKRDAAGRPTFKQYADGSKISYAYQPLSGRLLTITDEKSQVKTFSYNLDDSTAALTYTNTAIATPNVAFTYDPNFLRLTSMVDGTGTTSFAYHPIAPGSLGAGRLASETGPLPSSTITYGYDELGRSSGYQVNGIGETNVFDALGRMTSVTNPLGSFNYSYVGATDRTSVVSYPNGMTCAYGYHPLAGDFRLKDIIHALPGNVFLSQHSYTYNAAGNITRWTQTSSGGVINRSWLCGYDGADQLVSVASQDPTTFATLPTGQYAYTYDSAGNRLSETLDGATTVGSFNVLNQLVTLTNGGASVLPARTYEWDAEHRLTAINYPAANQRSEFGYDGIGRRVRIVERTNGVVQSDARFVWCGMRICESRDASGANVQRRLYENGEVVVGSPSVDYFYTRDHLGSVREAVDGTGLLATRYDYTPFGKVVNLQENLKTSFAYTGHHIHQPSGLHLALFRQLDSTTGRWLSRDPMGEGIDDNLYSYVINNPIHYVDKYGLDQTPCNPNNDAPILGALGSSIQAVAGGIGDLYVPNVRFLGSMTDLPLFGLLGTVATGFQTYNDIVNELKGRAEDIAGSGNRIQGREVIRDEQKYDSGDTIEKHNHVSERYDVRRSRGGVIDPISGRFIDTPGGL